METLHVLSLSERRNSHELPRACAQRPFQSVFLRAILANVALHPKDHPKEHPLLIPGISSPDSIASQKQLLPHVGTNDDPIRPTNLSSAYSQCRSHLAAWLAASTASKSSNLLILFFSGIVTCAPLALIGWFTNASTARSRSVRVVPTKHISRYVSESLSPVVPVRDTGDQAMP